MEDERKYSRWIASTVQTVLKRSHKWKGLLDLFLISGLARIHHQVKSAMIYGHWCRGRFIIIVKFNFAAPFLHIVVLIL